MSAEILTTRLIPEQGNEEIIIMDDYGTEYRLYVPVTDPANRQSRIDGALAKQSANQAALESYAAAHSIDLSAQRAVGAAKKAAYKG